MCYRLWRDFWENGKRREGSYLGNGEGKGERKVRWEKEMEQ